MFSHAVGWPRRDISLQIILERCTAFALQHIDEVFVGSDRLLRKESFVVTGVCFFGIPGASFGDVCVSCATKVLCEPAQFGVEAEDDVVAEDASERL